MARIPDRARMGAPRTASASPRAASMGDLGLSAVADALGRTQKGVRNDADRRAETAYLKSQGEFDQEYLPASQTYDGRAAGFARQQMARFDGLMTATAEGLDEGARRAFERARPQRRAAQLEAVTRVEAAKGGEIQREARQRARNIDVLGRLGTLRVGYGEDKRELLDGFDGSTDGLTDQALAKLDARFEAAIADAPEETREVLQERYAAMRGDEWMALQGVERQAQDAHLAVVTNRAAETAIAAVVTDPGQYDGAVRDLQAVAAELPEGLQAKFLDDSTQAAATARFQGLLQRGQWETVLGELEAGDWDKVLGADGKARVNQAAVQARAAAGFDPVSVQRQLDQQTAETRIQSHLASLMATGQSTGLTGAEVRRLAGPVAEAAFSRQETLARAAHGVTRGLAALPPVEQLARIEALKPQGGEPDFADRQAIYEKAVETLTAAQTLQARDPAQAVQTAPASAALWREFQAEPTATSARAWAADTLRRQAAMGVAETNRRILPKAYADQVAGRVKNAEGADTLAALQTAAALVGQFGGHEGAVLTDLTRAGVSARDAAMIGQAGDNPVALEAYARARNRGNVGLPATQRRDTREETVKALRPLLDTWAPLPGGQAGGDAFVSGVEAVASALVADGRSPREAAREAAQMYTEAYAFRDGWRVPRGQTQGRVTVGDQPRDRLVDRLDGLRIGAQRAVGDVVANGGQALAALGAETHLSEAQKRARYADVVASRGRWISTLDDGGLMLVAPDPRRPGGVTPVLNREGQPIRRTWDELVGRARSSPRNGRPR